MTTTQQISPNPAIDFAQSILDVTNNGLELIEILRDIAEDEEKANTNDRITAADTLMDRVFGKRPKQLYPNPDPAPSTESEPDPESAESDNHANHSSDISRSGPESPRLISQVNDSLNDTLGPAPTAQNPLSLEGEGWGEGEKNSIHFIIQQHILDITNNGQTLRDTLLKIARTEDDPRVTPYHRRRAAGILIDRALGTDPTPVLTAVRSLPELDLSDEDYPDYPPGYVFDPTKDCIYCSQSLNMPEGHEGEHRFDHEGFAEAVAEINRMMEEEGLPLFDPTNPPKSDHPINISSPSKKWVANNIDLIREASDKFDEKIKLRVERQKAWPAIEERRRKKLAEMYPSHSEDDGEPPDT